VILSHNLGLCPVNSDRTHESGRTNHANPAARPIVHVIYVGLAIYVALAASQFVHIAQKPRNNEIFIPLTGFHASVDPSGRLMDVMPIVNRAAKHLRA
jgi:hypothetical protein